MKKIYFSVFAFFSCLASFSQNNYFYANTVHHFETAVNGTQAWKYFVGSSEPDTNWRKQSFNDASWSTGNGGIGYGDGDDITMISAATSLYMRKQFTIVDSAKIYDILLSIDYDDGFVAYLNNVEIARKNVGTPGVIPTYNTPATSAHEANLYRSLNPEYFFVRKDAFKDILRTGANVLCIQIHNYATSGSDNDMTAIPYLMVGLNNSTVVYGSNPSWFKPPFYSHLPIIQIATGGQAIVNEPKKTMGMRIIDNGDNQNHITDSATEYSGKIGIELHGASSLNFPQKSYGLTTYDSLGNPDNVKIFGFPSESDFILYAPWNDKALMRNVMMYNLAMKMGWYASRCEFVEVYLDTSYVGVYVFMEKIKIDKARVPITQIKPNHNAGDSLTGGYIFKVDWNADAGLGTWNSHVTNYNGQAKTVRFQTSDPNGGDITQAQRNYIEAYIDSFEQNLLSGSMQSQSIGYRKYIDVGSFIDYFILYEITHNVDAYRASTYFFKARNSDGGKLVMGPVWDFNYSLGNASFCLTNDTNGWSGCTANNTLWWFNQLATDNYYKDQLRCRWTYLYNTLLSTNNINKYIDSVAAYLEVPQTRHFIKWNILSQDLNNGHTSTAYSQEITWLKNWYRGRTTWVNLFMPGWNNPCQESAFNGRVVVSELNYNSDKDYDAGNWIELYNNSSGITSLNNFYFTANGGANSKKLVQVSMPAYSYLVICEDTNLFNKVYPNVKNKIGNLGFGFSNGGSRIAMYDPLGYPVFHIVYSNNKPWPQGPDGGGKTLEHKGIGGSYNSENNWFEGCFLGSPGRPYGKCVQDVNVTEINYASSSGHNTGDWFELKNNGTVAMNLGGYVFKDDDDAHVFTFPNNFFIQPGEYIVVCSDTAKFKSFNPKVRCVGDFNFGISNNGDAIRLFTDKGILYQSIYYDDNGTPWPGGANGTGYTIELKADTLQCDEGSYWALGCLHGSPGKRYHKLCNPAINAKVSISELNLKPDPLYDDGGWIELHNYDTTAYDLADFTIAHSKLSDTAYLVKEGVVIPKNDYLLLCNDTAKFKKLHPGLNKIFPLTKWKFDPVHDTILIKDFNNNVLFNFEYNLNTTPHAEANGLGKTLELKYDTLPLANSSSWFNGCFEGSPGKAYSPCSKPKLIISEINYKSDPNFNQGLWFEIKNIDTASIDLNNFVFRKQSDTTGYRFKQNMKLLPGQYYAVSADSIIFTSANPFIQKVQYIKLPAFNLAGDLIRLFESGRPYLNAKFQDALPFPPTANGGGFTLNVVKDTLNPFLAPSWIVQCYGGSPGDTAGICPQSLTTNLSISEINYKPETNNNSGWWFEVRNNGSQPVDLKNWYLCNSDIKTYLKISGITIIPAGGYLVISNDSVKFKKIYPTVSNVVFTSQTFSSTSDSIRLFDARGLLTCKAFYSNDMLWPQGANGMGYTLENSSGNKNSLLLSDWKLGCLLGSPGTAFSPCPAPGLIISEVNYRSAPTANSGQWFELKNTTANPIDLNNYVIRFNLNDSLKLNKVIAPGNYLVVSADSVLFRKQHPHVLNLVKSSFKLDTILNSVKLFKAGVIVNGNFYSAANTILASANGGGYTLELINDTLNGTNESAWTTGCYEGSPGTAQLTPCNPASNSDLVFSEINYASDTFNNSGQWIELYNRSGSPANLDHWVLENSKGEFVVINGLTISAGAYHVLCNDTALFHKMYPAVTNYSLINLKLGKTSDNISLKDYSESNAALAGYSSDPTWPQGANGFGRTLENQTYANASTGRGDWRDGCTLGSPGKAAVPCVDKVQISEINYHPATNANDSKWFELHNNSSAVLNASGLVLRSNSSIFNYSNPVSLNPNSYLVFAADTTAFNVYHKYISNKVQFVGMNLQTGNTGIVLYDANKNILQSICYNSILPWDTMANGKGFTLELIEDSTNYNSANNWKSNCKRGSPGTATILPCGFAYGISESKSTFSVYPNPATNKLVIEIRDLNWNHEFEIYNLNGQLVMKGMLKDDKTSIDISALSEGVYFIRVSDMQAVKFVKRNNN